MLQRIWTSIKLFACYIFPFLPCCPKIGRLEDGDCIWVQAFGRNSISDGDLGKVLWDILKRSLPLNETFTLLKYSGFKPGKTNMALAKHAMKLSKKFGIPIVAQWEVVYCLWQIDLKWFLENQLEVDCLWPPEFGYYATWHVKLDSRIKMENRNKKRPIEVCQPAMTARAIAIIWKFQINVIVEAVHFWNFWKNPLWVWDPGSVQSWTTAFIFWLPREALGRYVHHSFLKRWVSFWQPS